MSRRVVEKFVPSIDWDSLELSEKLSAEVSVLLNDNDFGVVHPEDLKDREPGEEYPSIYEILREDDLVDELCTELIRTEQFRSASFIGCDKWQDYLAELEEQEEQEPADFQEQLLIRLMHGFPRLGNSRNINHLVNGTEKEAEDYMKGLKALAIFTWVFFGLWAVLLFYFKYRRRRSILSGSFPVPASSKQEVRVSCFERFIRFFVPVEAAKLEGSNIAQQTQTGIKQTLSDIPPPSEPRESRDSSSPDANSDHFTLHQIRNYNNQVRKARVCVLVLIPLIWLFSGLLIGYGFTALHQAIVSAKHDLPGIQNFARIANNATSEYVEVAKEAATKRFELLQAVEECDFNTTFSDDNIKEIDDILGGWKPPFIQPKPRVSIGTDLSSTSNFTELIETFQENLENFRTLSKDIRAIDKDLNSLNKLLNSTDDLLNSIDELWYYPVTAFIVIMDIIAFVLGSQVIMIMRDYDRTHRRRTARLISWAFPCFVLLLFLSYMIATICMVVSELLSDLCIGSPDEQVQDIVAVGHPFDRYIDWYLGGCDPQQRPVETYGLTQIAIGKAARILSIFLQVFLEFSDSLNSKISHLVCNGTAPVLVTATESLIESYTALLQLTSDMIPFFDCQQVYGVYVSFLHSTACDKAIRATTLTFVYLFSLALTCMMLITLRVAWHDNLLDTVEGDSDQKEILTSEEADNKDADPNAEEEEATPPEEGRPLDVDKPESFPTEK